MLARIGAGWTMALAALCASGCWANRADLDPAPMAETLPGDPEVARVEGEGITLLVAPDAWAGDEHILDQVTPMWIGLRNHSERPLAVRYGALRLVGRERIHVALPPVVADDDIIRLLGEGYEHADEEVAAALVADRVFDARSGFRLDPHLHPLWPELPLLTVGPLLAPHEDRDFVNASIAPDDARGTDPDLDAYESVYDRSYWRRHESWAAETRPIHPLVVAALPEGVLEPGGQIEGLVYFERVPDDLDSLLDRAPEPTLELVLDLVDARSGEPFGRLRVPFVVD